ncbi:MAG: hypothetical protein JXB47_03110 [Anaerolineae bacterium]|nr:hypothetical protein [Anaerolineae bacterium]
MQRACYTGHHDPGAPRAKLPPVAAEQLTTAELWLRVRAGDTSLREAFAQRPQQLRSRLAPFTAPDFSAPVFSPPTEVEVAAALALLGITRRTSRRGPDTRHAPALAIFHHFDYYVFNINKRTTNGPRRCWKHPREPGPRRRRKRHEGCPGVYRATSPNPNGGGSVR